MLKLFAEIRIQTAHSSSMLVPETQFNNLDYHFPHMTKDYDIISSVDMVTVLSVGVTSPGKVLSLAGPGPVRAARQVGCTTCLNSQVEYRCTISPGILASKSKYIQRLGGLVFEVLDSYDADEAGIYQEACSLAAVTR